MLLSEMYFLHSMETACSRYIVHNRELRSQRRLLLASRQATLYSSK